MARERERAPLKGTLGAIDELERLFKEFAAGGLLVPADALADARRRAEYVLGARADARAVPVVALGFAAELFAVLAVELAARPSALGELISRIEERAGIPRYALGHQVLSAPQLLQLPTGVAIEVQLALLRTFAQQDAVSVWTQWPGGDLRQTAVVGESETGAPRMRRVARGLLSDGSTEARTRAVSGIVVSGRHQQRVALVSFCPEGSPVDPKPMLDAAAPMMSAMVERDELLGRVNRVDAEVTAATARRLSRLRFDLHDGPQQDVILLGDDLRLFRGQLATILAEHPHRARALGRLEDLQAQLVAIDGDLRRIAAFVQSPFLQAEPLPDALASLADDFAMRSGVEPEMKLRGDFDKLSDSQQITLLGLIREALSNIREHSDAERVTISLTSDRRGVQATVTDDGCGFDPETSLVRAARDGHLGLVGMYERVRLLGGRTQIDSRPGGPTVISVTLPRVTMPTAETI
ncbi:MAG TPA: ATP-binding protein [Solirubrobacteraceae bacterium]|nr:ATP-binding protein [Solirubrobacteraceae bacterium]